MILSTDTETITCAVFVIFRFVVAAVFGREFVIAKTNGAKQVEFFIAGRNRQISHQIQAVGVEFAFYGTVGVIALTVGGILGGIYAAAKGLKKSLWPMSLSLALPCAVYLFMAAALPEQKWIVYLCVAFDQFGYGFGFTAYMLYMMRFSEGEFKTSHYAICTAFMALSMMIPGLFSGWLQEMLGYVGFFIMVMICCLATVFVTYFVRRRC